MKTKEEWLEELKDHPDCHFPTPTLMSWEFLEVFVEDIQRDALNSPFANTTDQQEIELARERANKAEEEIRRLNHNIEVYKERWHAARRYLRAANKGAERNNQVMRLLAYDHATMREKIKTLESTISLYKQLEQEN